MHTRLLGNRSSRRRFAGGTPELSDVQQRLVSDLTEHGIATASFGDLFGDRSSDTTSRGELWHDLSTDIESFAEGAAESTGGAGSTPMAKDEYLIRRLRRLETERRRQGVVPAEPTFSPGDLWVRLGISDSILEVVNTYRGMWTKLVAMDQWYTVPVGADGDRIASQNWHRDPEDLHVVKVFVYFSDVDEEAGPFQYIPGSPDGSRYGHLWPWKLEGGNYPPEEEIAELIPRSEHYTATGPRGTVIFCDTSGFHRGGFAKSKPRVMSYHTYVSPAAVLAARTPRRFHVDVSGANDRLSAPARFALT